MQAVKSEFAVRKLPVPSKGTPGEPYPSYLCINMQTDVGDNFTKRPTLPQITRKADKHWAGAGGSVEATLPPALPPTLVSVSVLTPCEL